MKIEMGESLFYSWLRHVKECQIVQTNWKASPQWQMNHEEELTIIMKKTDEFFEQKYGYKIYKKNSSLMQFISQGECDALGMVLDNGNVSAYAVDVAYHSNGLQYGSRETTVMKVVEKCIRTSMCLYGYMNIKDAEVIFASLKIGNSIMEDLRPCVNDAQEILDSLGFSFKLRIIANQDFKEMVLDAVILASDEVSDTNELFLRSYQLIDMFSNNASNNQEAPNQGNEESLHELKVGKYAQVVLKKAIDAGEVSDEELRQMQDTEYSKKTFGINYPVLAKVGTDYDSTRYYATPIDVKGVQYAVCSQWFETVSNNDRPFLEKWAKEKSISKYKE